LYVLFAIVFMLASSIPEYKDGVCNTCMKRLVTEMC